MVLGSPGGAVAPFDLRHWYTVMTLSQGETWKFETEPTQDIQVSRLRHEEPGLETVPRQDVSPDSIAVTCTLKVSYTW